MGYLVLVPPSQNSNNSKQNDSNNGKQKGLTEDKVEKGLSETEVPTSDPSSKPGADIESSEKPDDIKIYIGKNNNGKTPNGKPFAVESYEEYLERDAPPGFEQAINPVSDMAAESTNFGPSQLPNNDGTNVQPTSAGTDMLYVQEDIGSITLEGHTFNVGIGLGIQIEGTTAASIEATLSVDLYIDGASFSLTSFTVGYEVTDDGLCLGPFDVKYSVLRGLEVELCGSAGLTEVNGDQLEVTFGPSLSICADPCDGFATCAYCKEVSASFSETFDNPI